MKAHPSFSSHGKLLLFGEHAAVFGHPALGLSLDSTLSLTVTPAAENHFPGLQEREQNIVRALLDYVGKLLPNLTLPPAEYLIEGDIPPSSGFGSSAALCVCLAKYIRQLRGGSPEGEGGGEDSSVWKMANALESLFHGSPSGVDTGLACRIGLYAFFPQKNKLPQVLPLRRGSGELWLVMGAVPRIGTTGELVGKVREGMLQQKPEVVSAISQLGEYSRGAIKLLKGNNVAEVLGSLAQKAGGELKRLGLNHPAMDRLLAEGLVLGGLGGKLSGAGCGGAFYIICRSEASAQTVCEGLMACCERENIELSSGLKIKLI